MNYPKYKDVHFDIEESEFNPENPYFMLMGIISKFMYENGVSDEDIVKFKEYLSNHEKAQSEVAGIKMHTEQDVIEKARELINVNIKLDYRANKISKSTFETIFGIIGFIIQFPVIGYILNDVEMSLQKSYIIIPCVWVCFVGVYLLVVKIIGKHYYNVDDYKIFKNYE